MIEIILVPPLYVDSVVFLVKKIIINLYKQLSNKNSELSNIIDKTKIKIIKFRNKLFSNFDFF